MSKPQGLVRPEGLDKFKNSPHRASIPRPSGLYHIALTTTLPRIPRIYNNNRIETSRMINVWKFMWYITHLSLLFLQVSCISLYLGPCYPRYCTHYFFCLLPVCSLSCSICCVSWHRWTVSTGFCQKVCTVNRKATLPQVGVPCDVLYNWVLLYKSIGNAHVYVEVHVFICFWVQMYGGKHTSGGTQNTLGDLPACALSKSFSFQY
jgi:hypothetical protein